VNSGARSSRIHTKFAGRFFEKRGDESPDMGEHGDDFEGKGVVVRE
jgi:hypothetical protein